MGFEGSKKQAEEWINQDAVLSIHPEWLFEKGKNHRGPYYDVLKALLDVDNELDTLRTAKKCLLQNSA